jgi:hypothetical protein
MSGFRFQVASQGRGGNEDGSSFMAAKGVGLETRRTDDLDRVQLQILFLDDFPDFSHVLQLSHRPVAFS